MSAYSKGIEQGRGDLGHPSPPLRHAQSQDDLNVESLRRLAADARKALDAALARLGPIAAGERETRARLAEAQAALVARDTEYAESLRYLFDRLTQLEGIRVERDAALLQALAAESCCRSLEGRFEHILMKIPRRIARKFRPRFLSTTSGAPNDTHSR